jgi:hypothetical protein
VPALGVAQVAWVFLDFLLHVIHEVGKGPYVRDTWHYAPGYMGMVLLGISPEGTTTYRGRVP